MGVPWLDDPLMLHSSRADTCKLNAEQCAYRRGHWRYWYQADHVYALNTVYFFTATIGVFALLFWTARLAPARVFSKGWGQKVQSGFRFLAYRRFNPSLLLLSAGAAPSLGVLLLLGVGAIFFFAMTLGPKPYYWPNTRTLSFGGSPPIATRSGWMALACLPFMLILPTKANMIASLTGVSHERLIVFHKWVGWAMFVLGLIHTFPFIVHHIWNGDMQMMWEMDVTYWTGVVTLLAQAYLQFMSVSWIRKRYYELFKATHYLFAVVFVVFFFIHCDFRLTSWDYFIATGVLYMLSWLYSLTRTYFEHGPFLRARLEMVSGSAMKVTIPTEATWQPMQHVFLRFLSPGLHSIQAHPFTICSIPRTTMARSAKAAQAANLVFYVKPMKGITGRLARLAERAPGGTVPVLLDGPYGGIRGRPLHTYDHSLVVACGSGAMTSLPLVMDALLRYNLRAKTGGSSSSSSSSSSSPRREAARVQVVICTRDAGLATWYGAALAEFMDEHDISAHVVDRVQIAIYQTCTCCPGSSGVKHVGISPVTKNADADMANVEKKPIGFESVQETSSGSASLQLGRFPLSIFPGRPDIAAIVKDATLQPGVSVGIVCCGPERMMKVVQDEAAAAQLRILTDKPGAREVYLHSEVFGW